MSGDHHSPQLQLNSFSDLSQLSVLVVEDIAMNRDFAVEMLEELGLAVDTAVDGRRAVDKIQSQHYDLVLMDIEMPVMNGLEACQAIRLLGGHYASMPIIAMTSHDIEDVKSLSLAAGMNYFLTKPFDANQVVQTLFKLAA